MTSLVHYAKIFNTQVSTSYCGLFALAYAAALCLKYEPSFIYFDQDSMRQQCNEFIDGDLKEY